MDEVSQQNAESQSSQFRFVEQEYEENVPIDSIKPDPSNPHRADELTILRFIKANGFYGAVICRKETRQIIAGEHRWKAMRRANAKTIPVIWLSCSQVEAVKIMLADNRVAAKSHNDEALLRAALQDLASKDGMLARVGIDVSSPPTDLDRKKQVKASTKSGTVKFALGDYTFRVDASVYDVFMAKLLAKCDSPDLDTLAKGMAQMLGVEIAEEVQSG